MELKTFKIIIFILLFANNGFSQRYYKSEYIGNGQTIYNITKYAHPSFTLENAVSRIGFKNGQIKLDIDTTTVAFYRGFIINEHLTLSFELDSVDSEYHYFTSYITDKLNNTKYYFTNSRGFDSNNWFYYQIIKQQKCLTLTTINKLKRKEVTIFNFEDKTTTKYESTRWFDLIGNSDTSIYVYVPFSKTKINGKKYKKGSFISISSNGIKTLPINADEIKYERFAPVCFYNEDYIVQYKTLSKLPFNKEIEVIYQVNVIHNNKTIDSIFGMTNYFMELGTQVKYFNNRLQLFSNNFYKVYTENGNYTWDYEYWSKEIKELKYHNNDYFLKGDTLYLTTRIEISDSIGFNKENRKTFNNIQLNENSNQFQLVMAFNLKLNKFLGFPEIEFTNESKKKK